MGRWTKYYKAHENSKYDPLTQASVVLDKMLAPAQGEQSKTALDVGCGNGPDTLFLIENGYDVTAIDSEQEGIVSVGEAFMTKLEQYGDCLNM